VEEIVALGAGAATPQRRPRPRPDADPRLAEVAAVLADRLDTRVSVELGRRKGKITIEFASVEDLDRIAGALGRPAGTD
jgi:ParB family chromosome partitioning protein